MRKLAVAATALSTVAGLTASLGGCQLTQQKVITTTHHFHVTKTPTTNSATSPTVVIKHVQHLKAGQTGVVANSQGQHITIKVNGPSVARTHYGDYGDDPEHGYFLTFRVTLKNVGDVQALIQPTQFRLDVGGDETDVDSYDGAAPYSGVPVQLDSTVLTAGQLVSHPLTFDVDATHGTMTFEISQKPTIIWRF